MMSVTTLLERFMNTQDVMEKMQMTGFCTDESPPIDAASAALTMCSPPLVS